MIDFTALTKAVASLAQALEMTRLRADDLDLLARDGCIQRFEYTYELCVKSMRRQLDAMADSAISVDELGFKDMVRMAAERGLIADPQAWFAFRELRNITVHTYDQDKAQTVFAALPSFLKHAQQLDKLLRKSAA